MNLKPSAFNYFLRSILAIHNKSQQTIFAFLGVILTHANITTTLSSFLYNLDPKEGDMYIAYLPLAHVLELLGESMMVVWGITIGYSGPNTLTDKSTMIKSGHKGDATVLQPTIMFCVPLILDRIYKGVTENIKKKGEFVSRLMDYCIQYKLGRMRNGEVTPILDRVLFSGIRALLGGRVRGIMSGGAPLAPDTHDYLRTILCCPILQVGTSISFYVLSSLKLFKEI